MREYGQVQTIFWNSADIRSLTHEAKLLAVYLLTSPHTNALGCYRLPIGYVAADLDWQADNIRQRFQELVAIGFASRCELTDWVLIPKYLKWNPPQNGNVGKRVQALAELVPKTASIYHGLIESLRAFGRHIPEPFLNGLATVPEPFGNRIETKTLPKPTQPEDAYQEEVIAKGVGSSVYGGGLTNE